MAASFITPMLIILSSLPCFIYASLSVSPVTMTTTLGDVTGVRKNAGDNKKVEVYYGIPFAQPPVNELRFRPPVPAEPWEGRRDATQKPNSCWQAIDTAYDRFPGVEMWNPNTPRSEDCLYLNVWRPAGSENNPREPKTIMVWIFGGGFWSGTATLDLYEATQLSARNDVIVVTIGYRLGPLGFLYLGTDDAPGNAGLLDQAMALQWVKDNAVNLGGSPDDITIFGESAGAVSVGFHLLSPLSRDLYSYAIMQSASPIVNWGIQTDDLAKDRAARLAQEISCSGSNSTEIANCLRAADPEVLIGLQWNLITEYVEMPFGPVVDGHFLPDLPLRMIGRGDIKMTNVILGVDKNEGIYFDLYGFMKDFPLTGSGNLTEAQFNRIVRTILHDDEELVSDVEGLYRQDGLYTFKDIIDAISGDTLFKCPVITFGQLYSQLGGTVFMYDFEHRASTSPWPEWLGVLHGDEIQFIFGQPLAPNSLYTEEEKELSSEIMTMFTQFAKTGNPNYPDQEVEWPEYSAPSESYLILDTEEVKVSHGLRHQECAFWFEQRNNTMDRPTESAQSSIDINEAAVPSSESLLQERYLVLAQ